MSHTITLDLPDALYARIERQAKGTRQPVEAMLLNVLQTTLPSIDELPPDLIAMLQDLEMLESDELRLILLETVPDDVHSEIEALLSKNRAGTLSEAERSRLDALQRRADEVMLRKARSAVLLRFRGERLPTMSELRQLSERR